MKLADRIGFTLAAGLLSLYDIIPPDGKPTPSPDDFVYEDNFARYMTLYAYPCDMGCDFVTNPMSAGIHPSWNVISARGIMAPLRINPAYPSKRHRYEPHRSDIIVSFLYCISALSPRHPASISHKSVHVAFSVRVLSIRPLSASSFPQSRQTIKGASCLPRSLSLS